MQKKKSFETGSDQMPILPLMKYDIRSSLEHMGWGEETLPSPRELTPRAPWPRAERSHDILTL